MKFEFHAYHILKTIGVTNIQIEVHSAEVKSYSPLPKLAANRHVIFFVLIDCVHMILGGVFVGKVYRNF